jgi:hypothetical protein
MQSESKTSIKIRRPQGEASTVPLLQHLSQPSATLFTASTATLLYALWIIRQHEGWREWWLLYYFAPITFPFVCFLIERADMLHTRTTPRWPWLVDIPVLAISITRAFYALPFISGHAFFLSYALLTTRTKPARISAALVLVEVACLKIFLWHDWTLLGGMTAAGISAMLLFRLKKLTMKNAQQ